MEMNEFILKISKAMEKEFGDEYHVELKEVCKNNGVILHGLLIATQGKNVVPTIYLDDFWEAYERGMTFSDIVKHLVEIYQRECNRKNIDMEFFRKFDCVKDRICAKLINRKENEDRLKSIPYIPFIDLAIVFYYAYQDPDIGEGSILIHNSHLEMWKTNLDVIYGLAKHNTPRLFPYRIYSMEEMIFGIVNEKEPVQGVEEYREFLDEIPMKVLSNEQKCHGAICLLYPGVASELATLFPKGFFVLPSSIHELILLPCTGKESPRLLEAMIHDVNRTQVSPEELLCDSLYYFDSMTKNIHKVVSSHEDKLG
jgi:hypothetical protein